MTNDALSKDLFLKLKNKFPNIKMGDASGMTTNNPKDAVFFDFPFLANGQKIASISISIAQNNDDGDDNTLRLFYSKDILKDKDQSVKSKWFDFLKDMRNFSKTNLLNFEPTDIEKKNLDKRDYKHLAATAENTIKDRNMKESSLSGSTRSSYQTLENTKLIIRHSKKIQEESPNSRTRNIESLFIQSENGERFRYPFIHLSGARAMQRHIANGGVPYDNFGQYIVNLSEQVYNLRKFNNLVTRKSFLENSEISEIANKAKIKTNGIKKMLERLQKQGGYETVKENFTEFKKRELDEKTLEALKNRFTIQQFNEELVELFPYISDLVSEGIAMDIEDHFKKDLPMMLKDLKAKKMGASDMRRTYGSSWKKLVLDCETMMGDCKRSTLIKFASDSSTQVDEISDKVAKKVAFKRASDYASADDNPTGGSPEEEKAWNKLQKNTKLMKARSEKKTEASKPGDKGYDPSDAAEEPLDVRKEIDPAYDLSQEVKKNPSIEIEQWDKISIQKMIDHTIQQVAKFKQAVAEKPKDKNSKYSLEKAEARLKVLKDKLHAAELALSQMKNGKYSLFFQYISNQIKSLDSPVYRSLNNIGRFWDSKNSKTGKPVLDIEQKKEALDALKILLKNAKIVPLFYGNPEVQKETLGFEDLESFLSTRENSEQANENTRTNIDPVTEFENILDNIIDEESNILSSNESIRHKAVESLNKLMAGHFPAGTNGINAIESLKGIIDDQTLNNNIKTLSQENADACVRPVVMDWIKTNAPDLESQISTGDMEKSEDSEDIVVGKENEESTNPNPREIMEFVKSLFNLEDGTSPRGPTGVQIAAEKKFGDSPEIKEYISNCIKKCQEAGDSELQRIKELSGLRI